MVYNRDSAGCKPKTFFLFFIHSMNKKTKVPGSQLCGVPTFVQLWRRPSLVAPSIVIAEFEAEKRKKKITNYSKKK